MAFAKLWSAQPGLIESSIITVETDLTKGLHQFTVVGLPDKAVEESRDRVSAAIKNSGWKPPKQHNQKITVSLAPANIKKEGPSFDLPIALAYLLATQNVSFDPIGKLFVGELALDGSVRKVRGILGVALAALAHGYAELFVPKENAEEAALVSGLSVFPIESLGGLVAHLERKEPILPLPQTSIELGPDEEALDEFAQIRGQEIAKRALEIAAAGGHNVALWGPPGTGKTLLAKALRSLMPPLSHEEMLEVTAIHSIASDLEHPITRAPFRSPHHTASHVSVVGGGAVPKPGEVTLAHRGVLFLDEFPEFDKRVIESLRQPLEEGVVQISRARGSERFPARFILVAAMNPCPCGYYGDARRTCVCVPAAIARYRRKISGPIIDRIDMWIEVPRMEHEALSPGMRTDTAPLLEAQRRIVAARARQKERTGPETRLNAHMGVKDIDRTIRLAQATLDLFNASAKKLDLSARAYHRTLKLARTISDLAGSKEIAEEHLLEALQYRPKKVFS